MKWTNGKIRMGGAEISSVEVDGVFTMGQNSAGMYSADESKWKRGERDEMDK